MLLVLTGTVLNAKQPAGKICENYIRLLIFNFFVGKATISIERGKKREKLSTIFIKPATEREKKVKIEKGKLMAGCRTFFRKVMTMALIEI